VPAEVSCSAARGQAQVRALKTDANALLRLLKLEQCELSIALIGDRVMRRLNHRYRDKDAATDVLSFPQFDGRTAGRLLAGRREGDARAMRGHPPLATVRAASAAQAPPIALGDIAISIDTAARQAVALGQGVAARLRTLLIHGLLHLLGYDHERSPAEARRMYRREREFAAMLAGGRSAGIVRGRATEAGQNDWPPAAMPAVSRRWPKHGAAPPPRTRSRRAAS
jgi:rRNA maturation RNase YbeY